ncbi:MAG: FecR domain-containing protein [Sphingobium sp.]|nr:FecR domain-containing protein [Sphingobium sp.]
MTDQTGWTDTELAQLRLEGLSRLTHLLSGEATERDAAELVAWRMQSRAHEEAFRSAVRFRQLVRSLDGAERPMAMADSASEDRDNVVPFRAPAAETDAPPIRKLSRRNLIGGAIAASVAGGMVMFGRSIDLVPSPWELASDYRTKPGERRLVHLAQGATVELNTRTSIDLRNDMGMPAVELLSGEALMTSPRNGRVALVAGEGTSIGRDGHFNARRDGDDICITCLRGAVDVRWDTERRSLGPNDQVRYSSNGIGPVERNVDTITLTAWKAGTLIFQNMPMRDVIKEINRYRPGRVYLTNDALAERPLSGTYYVNRLDDFFDQARLAFGAKVTKLPGSVVILA